MEPIAVLASGGLDSAVLIADSARDNTTVHPIYVQWGLAWEDMERVALDRYIAALKNPNVKPVTILSAPIKPMYGADHWSITGKAPAYDARDETVYLPGRNILLLALAAVWCSTHNLHRIAIGSLVGNPFADATPEFFKNFGGILGIALEHPIKVEAPFRGLHKEDLIKKYQDLPLELTLTCMSPKNGMHCAHCNKCRERQEAFRDAHVTDHTTYAV